MKPISNVEDGLVPVDPDFPAYNWKRRYMLQIFLICGDYWDQFRIQLCWCTAKTHGLTGEFLSLDQQLDMFETSIKDMRSQFASHQSLHEHLSKSISFLHIYSNLLGLQHTPLHLYRMNPKCKGIVNVLESCCVDQYRNHNDTSLCWEDSAPCEDRSTYMFYDPFHPTEIVHFNWASRVLKDQPSHTLALS